METGANRSEGGGNESAATEVRHLPLAWRVAIFTLSWIAILIGIAGGFVPVLQGWIFLVLGVAMLSLTSVTAFKVLRWCFRPWPRGWRRVLEFRQKLYAKLDRDADDAGPTPDANA